VILPTLFKTLSEKIPIKILYVTDVSDRWACTPTKLMNF